MKNRGLSLCRESEAESRGESSLRDELPARRRRISSCRPEYFICSDPRFDNYDDNSSSESELDGGTLSENFL